MTHSRMNQPSQIQPELFLACPLRSFGVCLHSPRMLKHQRCCGSWDWHGKWKLEGRTKERGDTGQRWCTGSVRENTGRRLVRIVQLSPIVWAICGMVLPHIYQRYYKALPCLLQWWISVIWACFAMSLIWKSVMGINTLTDKYWGLYFNVALQIWFKPNTTDCVYIATFS